MIPKELESLSAGLSTSIQNSITILLNMVKTKSPTQTKKSG